MTPSPTPSPQNIILIVLDTHRSDRLGFNGYPRGTSPNLDEFARSGSVFERAIAPAQWTIPSHASMFTGLPPSTHLTTQANSVLDGRFPTFAELLARKGYETTGFCNNPLVGLVHNNLKRGFKDFYNYSGTTPDIPSDFPEGSIYPFIHMWESFRNHIRKIVDPIQNQFATNTELLVAATNPFFVPLWSRFVHFKGNTSKSIHDAAHYLSKKADHPGERPFFMFLNLMETHLPYVPPREYVRRFAPYYHEEQRSSAFMKRFNTLAMHWLIPLKRPFMDFEAQTVSDLYDAEVAYQDHLLNELFAQVQKPALLDNSLVVILADHGEMLGEHQFMGHGFGVFRELIHVPLVIHTPGQAAGNRVTHRVLTTRLFQTVLTAAGIPQAQSLAGTMVDVRPYSLTNEAAGLTPPESAGLTVISEAYAPQDAVRMMEHREPELIDPLYTRQTHRAVYQGDYKLYDIENVHHSLLTPEDVPLDLTQYPAGIPEAIAEQLARFVQASREGRPEGWTPAAADLSNPLIEQRLRDLGYML